jgi:hypothetical protein
MALEQEDQGLAATDEILNAQPSQQALERARQLLAATSYVTTALVALATAADEIGDGDAARLIRDCCRDVAVHEAVLAEQGE